MWTLSMPQFPFLQKVDVELHAHKIAGCFIFQREKLRVRYGGAYPRSQGQYVDKGIGVQLLWFRCPHF